MAQELTLRGKVFAAYANAIVRVHGFGSNKMVAQDTPEFIRQEMSKAQRLVNRAMWAKEKFEIDHDEFEAALAAGEEGKRIFREFGEAEDWLIENGWLRKYLWSTRRTYYRGHSGTSIGLTAKGWAVARKYLDA